MFFSMPHIAVNATGKVGVISRPGRSGESCACGALAASLGSIKSEGLDASCKKPGGALLRVFPDKYVYVVRVGGLLRAWARRARSRAARCWLCLAELLGIGCLESKQVVCRLPGRAVQGARRRVAACVLRTRVSCRIHTHTMQSLLSARLQPTKSCPSSTAILWYRPPPPLHHYAIATYAVHDYNDPELSILKQRLARRMRYENYTPEMIET